VVILQNLRLFQNIKTISEIPVGRIAIKLKRNAEKHVKQGHPWVFESAIVKQNKEGKAGDIAIIFDQKDNKFLAIGLYDPYSMIRIKVLSAHQSIQVNNEWFRTIISEAKTKRIELLQQDTDGYRLLHGENDGLPGLVADVYGKHVVVKYYSSIWKPYQIIIEQIILEVAEADCLVSRTSRVIQQNPSIGLVDGAVRIGELKEEQITFKEHGLLFHANLIKGHKTGYFLDQRHNRHKVSHLSKGKKVLDVFAYAGGFSVHALAGGASEVTSIDISKQALTIAAANAQLNFDNTDNHHLMAVDAFQGLDTLFAEQKKFGIVIVDPPSFAKQASEVETAINSYKRLVRSAVRLVSNDGIFVMASCSSRIDSFSFFEFVEDALLATDRNFQLLEKTFHDIDHPISFPEGAYLKCGYYKIF
jgi:23S rRNA (cytosine1962-C5)-methyltransferase